MKYFNRIQMASLEYRIKRRIIDLNQNSMDIQKKVFTNWCNSILKEAGEQIQDLGNDFRDGVKLLLLLEILTGEKLPNPERGGMRIHKIANVNKALEFLRGKTTIIVSVEAIVDGNVKATLGLIWVIILTQQVNVVLFEEQEGKKGLLEWCNSILASYESVKVDNFDVSFKDGLVFCAMVNTFRPGLIDFHYLSKHNPEDNLRTAFHVAEKYLGVTNMLDPKDIVNSEKPDEKSIMAYVSALYHASSEVRHVATKAEPSKPEREHANTEEGHFYDAIEHVNTERLPNTMERNKKSIGSFETSSDWRDEVPGNRIGPLMEKEPPTSVEYREPNGNKGLTEEFSRFDVAIKEEPFKPETEHAKAEEGRFFDAIEHVNTEELPNTMERNKKSVGSFETTSDWRDEVPGNRIGPLMELATKTEPSKPETEQAKTEEGRFYDAIEHVNTEGLPNTMERNKKSVGGLETTSDWKDEVPGNRIGPLMEVSGRQYKKKNHGTPVNQKSIDKGSAEYFELRCDPCYYENGVDIEAMAFCKNCDEHFCGSCLRVHRKTKMSRNHIILDVNKSS